MSTGTIKPFAAGNHMFWTWAMEQFLAGVQKLLSGSADHLDADGRLRAGTRVAVDSLRCPLAFAAVFVGGSLKVRQAVVRSKDLGPIPIWAVQGNLPSIPNDGILRDVLLPGAGPCSFQWGDDDPLRDFGILCAVAVAVDLGNYPTIENDGGAVLVACNRAAKNRDGVSPYPADPKRGAQSFGGFDDKMMHCIARIISIL